MKLDVSNISVTLGDTDIVRDISLKVNRQQFVGLIGANGCGKSTLLKSLYKSLKPNDGAVFLNDIDVLKASPKKVSQQLGVVGQFNEMSFDFTVQEMVMMGRTPHKGLLEADSHQDHEIVAAALSQVHLTEYAERSYMSLSGGEKQRVILARSIAQQPKFLILDEPTNHLDIKYQIQILSTVKQLGVGILAALHDLTLAADYCDYLYALKDGAVIAHGRPEDLLTKTTIRDIYDVECEIYTNPVTGGFGISYFQKV